MITISIRHLLLIPSDQKTKSGKRLLDYHLKAVWILQLATNDHDFLSPEMLMEVQTMEVLIGWEN